MVVSDCVRRREAIEPSEGRERGSEREAGARMSISFGVPAKAIWRVVAVLMEGVLE